MQQTRAPRGGNPSAQEQNQISDSLSWSQELRATFILAWPLVLVQIAGLSINTTDVIMMGWLGPEYLAAGSLSFAVLTPTILFSIAGVLGAITPLVAQAIGARQYRAVRRTTRQGLWIALLLAAISIPFLLQIEWIIKALGQSDRSAELGYSYMKVAAWYLIPTFLFATLRNFIAAHGKTTIILYITLGGIIANIIGNYALMFGNFGFPRLELTGAGISTVIVSTLMLIAALIYVLTHKKLKRYAILVRMWKPDWPVFVKILRIGIPIGLMVGAETGLFSAASVMMGWLGTDELAGHAIALQITATTFMVPLGISFAATIRVGNAYGRNNKSDIGTAGWVSLIISTAFMSCSLLLFILTPHTFVHLFLNPDLVKNAAPIALAAGYLTIAGMFQLVDGAQVAAAASLRGLNDTKVPMIIAIISYWGIGMPTGYLLAFTFELRGIGIWLGLAAGLACAAIVLIHRFSQREKLGLTARPA